jgi:hypothetical protein
MGAHHMLLASSLVLLGCSEIPRDNRPNSAPPEPAMRSARIVPMQPLKKDFEVLSSGDPEIPGHGGRRGYAAQCCERSTMSFL